MNLKVGERVCPVKTVVGMSGHVIIGSDGRRCPVMNWVTMDAAANEMVISTISVCAGVIVQTP